MERGFTKEDAISNFKKPPGPSCLPAHENISLENKMSGNAAFAAEMKVPGSFPF